MIRKAGTAITLIFVFSVGQVMLALNSSSRPMAMEATIARSTQNGRDGRRNGRWRRWRARGQRRHRMERRFGWHRRREGRRHRIRNR